MVKSGNVVPINRPHNLNRALKDTGYRHRERDPELEWICNEIILSGRSTWAISQKIREATGGAFSVSPSTMDKWLEGKTIRPQNFTVNWVAYALGYTREWRRI